MLAGLEPRHLPRFLLVETQHPQEVSARVAPLVPVTQLSHHDYLFARGSTDAPASEPGSLGPRPR